MNVQKALVRYSDEEKTNELENFGSISYSDLVIFSYPASDFPPAPLSASFPCRRNFRLQLRTDGIVDQVRAGDGFERELETRL